MSLKSSITPCIGITQTEANTRVASIHKTLLKIYKQEGKQDLELAEFEYLSSVSPNDPELCEQYALELLRARRYQASAEQFRRAIKLSPDNAENYVELGQCLSQLSDYAGQKKAYETATRLKYPVLKFPANVGIYLPWTKITVAPIPLRTSMVENRGKTLSNAAQLSVNTRVVSVNIKNIDISIRHEDRQNIALISNYPEHWIDKAGSITQTAITQCPIGAYQTINNSDTITFAGGNAEISPEQIRIGGKIYQDTIRNPEKAGNIDFSGDGIELSGTRMRTGALDRAEKNEMEVAQLLIPKDYSGILELRTNCRVTIDRWRGPINVFAGRPCDIELDSIEEPGPCDIASSGYANVVIGKIQASTLSVNSSGSSALCIGVADVGTANLTAADKAKIGIKEGSCQICKISDMNQQIKLPADFISKQQ